MTDHAEQDGAQDGAQDGLERRTAIVEDSDDAIVGTNLDGVIKSWNTAAVRLFGYRGEEIIGEPIEVLSEKDRTDRITAALVRIKLGGDTDRFESVCVRKDETAFLTFLTISPACDPAGEIVGVSTMVRDMTNQRQAFDSARTMIESTLDPLVAIGPEGKITDANQATVEATGLSRDELIGTSFSEYFTEPDKADEIYQLVLSGGMTDEYPLTMRHRNGALTEVRYNASVYRDAEDKVLGVFAAARDVTKQMEAQAATVDQEGEVLDRQAKLERLQQLTVGREAKMYELKRENESLRKRVVADDDDPGVGQ